MTFNKVLILALNSSTIQTEMALIDFGTHIPKVFFEKAWVSHKDEAEKILPAIDEGLREAGMKNEDIGEIFVVNGPGAFSGLRIGVTIANALAFSTGAKLFSCSSFELLQHKIVPTKRKETAMIIGGGGANFALMLPGDQEPRLCEDAKELVDTLETTKSIKFLMPDLRPYQLESLAESGKLPSPGIQFLPEKFTQKFSEAIIDLYPEKSGHNVKIIAPLYLRTPTITKSKKQNFTDGEVQNI